MFDGIIEGIAGDAREKFEEIVDTIEKRVDARMDALLDRIERHVIALIGRVEERAKETWESLPDGDETVFHTMDEDE